jgi:hypothetical protein
VKAGRALRVPESAVVEFLKPVEPGEHHSADAIRLREILVQVAREVNLADLSPGLRHAIEQERENEVE